jgi:glycosyltransferase involved in cell wall biosynthesis
MLTADRSRLAVPPVRLPWGRPVRTMILTSRQGKPAQEVLRQAIAADQLPNSIAADEAVGATVVDERYIAALPGPAGSLLRRLPLLLAQALVVLLTAGRYDTIVTWGERHTLMVAVVQRLVPRRVGHVAILMWPSKRNRALLRALFGHIDRFIVWPPLQRRYTEDELGVAPSRFVEVHAPVDTDFWRPMDGAGDLICSPGQEMRDYGTLLEALDGLDIPCHIAAGQGLFDARFLAEEWHANVGERPIPANVTLGRRPHAELRALYARARFVVVPLRPSEMDNGITVITESFAMGKAVICTDSPGQTGILESGVNCLRVPPGDPAALRAAILELWNDPERCERLGAAGRRAVEERHGLGQWRAALGRAVVESALARQRH